MTGAKGRGAGGRVRLEDVAAAAQVSKSIASRVLNGDASVSVREETRRRIATAARELGYRPNPLARALATTATGALALLVPAFANVAYADLIRGATDRARTRDYVLLAAEDSEGQEADGAFAGLVGAGRVDGLVIASALPARPLLTALERSWVPHVFVNRAVPGAVANVVLDVEAAGRIALEHLVELGHERLGHVAGPADVEAARRREDAFVAAGAARGLAPVVARGSFDPAGGAQATRELLAAHPDVTALWASSFGQALGTLRAAADAGRRVPEDLSVLAYEDVVTAQYTVPRLSTVAIPMRELGAASVDVLLEQVGGAGPGVHRLPARPRLVVRESTCPPRAAA